MNVDYKEVGGVEDGDTCSGRGLHMEALVLLQTCLLELSNTYFLSTFIHGPLLPLNHQVLQELISS